MVRIVSLPKPILQPHQKQKEVSKVRKKGMFYVTVKRKGREDEQEEGRDQKRRRRVLK